MKARGMLFLSSLLILLSIITFGAKAQDKYVPKANEELYGTWINNKSINSYHVQKAVHIPNAWREFSDVKDTVPHQEGTVRIDDKWTDSDGTIWYKTFNAITSGTYKGFKVQALQKISQSGSVKENVSIAVGEFDPKLYPTEIDPKDDSYQIFYRAEE